MPSVFLKRAIPICLVVFASAAAALYADPAAARRSSKAPTQIITEPGFNGRAKLAVVAIKDQRISVYDANGAAMRARISSGRDGYETPVGVFSLLQKNIDHRSNLYDDAEMPFMQRITWSGIALHAGQLPGYPASHGCVRLPYSFAQKIFSMTKLGMRVVISRNDVAPVNVSHPLLLKPEPIEEVAVATPTAYEPTNGDNERATIFEPEVQKWPAREALLDDLQADAKQKSDEADVAIEAWKSAKAELGRHKKDLRLIARRDGALKERDKRSAQLAKAKERLANSSSQRSKRRAEDSVKWAQRALEKAEASLTKLREAAAEPEKVIAALKETIATAEAAKTLAEAAAAKAKQKALPVSVFISRDTQKLYVRQGNTPVFDVDVAVAEPRMEIGTHVFTALDYAGDGNDVRWNVVSISRQPLSKEHLNWGEDYEPPLTDADAATAALERISIPANVRERISKYVWPGSSLIISDEAPYKETSKNTDFIVIASDQPQGALKIRPKQPPRNEFRDYYYDDYYYSSPRYYRRYEYRRRRYNDSVFSWW